MMDKSLQETLSCIGNALNKENIVWGVGASVLLYQYGLTDNPTDIDITVSVSDSKAADAVLSKLGTRRDPGPTALYLTDYFYEYEINNTEIDLIGGLKISTTSGTYTYLFDQESIGCTKQIEGEKIPFSNLEEWYVLYQLMPGKENKVSLIEDYFKTNGIEHVNLLIRMLEGENLPLSVKKRIENILSSYA